MDFEKISHILDETKGADVAFYLLLAFALISPGFMVLFVYKPDLIITYDLVKLLILCISLSGISLILFVAVIWTCIQQNGGDIDLRPCLMMAAIASIITIYFSLGSKTPHQFFSGYYFWLGTIGAMFSVIAGRGRHWFKRYIFNVGVLLMILMFLLGNAEEWKQWFLSLPGK